MLLVCRKSRCAVAVATNLPRDLETICLKCLQKERVSVPHGRELAMSWAFLNNEPIHARPIGFVGRTWRWCRRNPVLTRERSGRGPRPPRHSPPSACC